MKITKEKEIKGTRTKGRDVNQFYTQTEQEPG